MFHKKVHYDDWLSVEASSERLSGVLRLYVSHTGRNISQGLSMHIQHRHKI